MDIDGSYGEGGGQIVRNAIALSAISGRPCRVFHIRAGRKSPGMKAQHVAAVEAVRLLTDSMVVGNTIGSLELEFFPAPEGMYEAADHSLSVDVGTAGSIPLVLQAIVPVATYFCRKPVSIMLRGGTDVEWAPSLDYFRNVAIPLFSSFGVAVKTTLYRRGYFPAGEGRLRAMIMPAQPLPVECLSRGEFRRIRGNIHYAGLPYSIPDRIHDAAMECLKESGIPESKISIKIETEQKMDRSNPAESGSPGCGLTLWAEFGNSVIGACLPGRKRLKSETLSRRVVESLIPDLMYDVATDTHSADQLIILAAVTASRTKRPCIYTCRHVSEHTTTAIWLCERFLPVRFEILEKCIPVNPENPAKKTEGEESFPGLSIHPGVVPVPVPGKSSKTGSDNRRPGIYQVSALPA